MSSPMTLREAVSIERIGPPSPPRWSDFDESPESGPIYERDMSTWNRARAIVDAAVETWESSCAYSDALDEEPFNGRLCAELCRKWQASEKKLRALERGLESEVQP